MPIHLMREIERVKKMILSLAALVENNVRLAVKSVVDRDADLALKVIETDHEIDRAEVDVEEECLKILALYQPVATDLRFIVGMLKINHDLERIGDLAVNMAERAHSLSAHVKPHLNFDLMGMAEKAREMVARSLDALINHDLSLAKEIWLSDDEVDSQNRAMYRAVEDEIRRHPQHLEGLLCLLSVSRNLERIADHATNIAKDVIYMIEGEIVRHRSREYREKNNVKPAGNGASPTTREA